MFTLKVVSQSHCLSGLSINLPVNRYSDAVAYALRIGTELSANIEAFGMELQEGDFTYIGLRFIKGDLTWVYKPDELISFDDELDGIDDDELDGIDDDGIDDDGIEMES